MKKCLFLFINALIVVKVFAQTDTSWHNKKCAVVLTYDDGLNVDLSNAIPALDSVGLKGTFYISDYSNVLKDQIAGWRAAAKNGHELANHTVHHPCVGSLPGREFVKPDYDLNNYTVRRMVDEIRSMNVILKAIDGNSNRTFAYPCGDATIHDTSYIEPLKNDFIAARGVKAEMLPIDKIDLYNIGCYPINGETGDQLVALVKKAMESHTLLVFLFHGVGGGHSLNVSIEAHRQLLYFLKENRANIWIAPLIEVAEYIKTSQAKKSN